MTTILLIIIYIAFISLGLPDSMLGATWPMIRQDLSMPMSGAGLVAFITCAGTIVSSLFSGWLIKKLGTGKLTLISVLMTAVALLGVSTTKNYLFLCLFAVPLGLGAGAVDAGLNNFVALNFSAKHMSWLHCFWGVGATAGPIIMSAAIARTGMWQKGYWIVAIIQFFLVGLLFVSLPIWNRFKDKDEEVTEEATKGNHIIRLPGIIPTMLGFFCYCALETSAGLWGASYLVQGKGLSAGVAAGWMSMFFLGITLGRFLNGFFTIKFSNPQLIRVGEIIIGLGAIVLLIFNHPYTNLIGLVLIGFGCAPIYPSMLHETPIRFGKHNSTSLMGLQMAFAYVGSTVIPPVLGLFMDKLGIGLYPVFILILLVVMLISSEKVNRTMVRKA